MKNLVLVLFSLIFFCSLAESRQLDNDYYINGPYQVTLTGASVGASYSLYYPPSGATYVWKIQSGGGAYISSSNGTYCSLTFYQKGQCRLSCEIYIDGVRVDTSTIYIMVN
jgi:hypothetical protein